MIKDFKSKRYNCIDTLPRYVTDIRVYRLFGLIKGGYTIVLAKLTVGSSVSSGTPLAHALFESFTDHGEPARTAKVRASGPDREITAVRNAMLETGFVLNVTFPESSEKVLYAIGQYFQRINRDIETFSVVSQTCH